MNSHNSYQLSFGNCYRRFRHRRFRRRSRVGDGEDCV